MKKEEFDDEEEKPPIDEGYFCDWPRCKRETALFVRIEEEGIVVRRIPLCDDHAAMFLSENPKEEAEAYRVLKIKKDKTVYKNPPPPEPTFVHKADPEPTVEKKAATKKAPKEVTQKPKLDVDSKIGSLLDRLRAGEFELKDG